MSDIQTAPPRGKDRRGASTAPRIDLTALVDLAFLLLSFFMLTSALQKSSSLIVTYPPAGKPTALKTGITFLMDGHNRLFYYEGQFYPVAQEGRQATQLKELRYDGGFENSLQNFLSEKTKTLHNELKELIVRKNKGFIGEQDFLRLSREIAAQKEHYTFLLKPGKEASYQNVVDVLDELKRFSVAKYTIADIHTAEEELMNHQNLRPQSKE